MKKVLPVLIALALIAVVIAVGFGGKLMDKYSYSKEEADLDEYFGVADPAIGDSDGQLAIVLQDEIIEQKAIFKNGYVYFDLDTVHELFNEIFYVDMTEQKLLYTTANEIVTALFDQTEYLDTQGAHTLPYIICYREGDTLYVAADYVKRYTNYSYDRYDRHLQVYTKWGTKQTFEIAKNTQVRLKGGIKSPILCQIEAGQTVELLEQMETWSKIKTSDAVIGYVENKRLINLSSEVEIPVTDYVPQEYSGNPLDSKVCLGWHAIGGVGGNDTINAMMAEGDGMNVIAPTWFSLTDDQGNFRSYAGADYVKKAHDRGLKVWGVWDNFNYKNETGEAVSTYAVLSSTTIRQRMSQDIVANALEFNMDGVNIDFEGLTQDCGVHFIQFIRELSILCRSNNLTLSVDNYVPLNFNNYYRLDIQGQVADYVIIMGYDEHWHGSGNPGSVASIDYVSGGIERTVSQVPAEKVVNALPFYMIQWKTEGTTVTDEYVTLNHLADYLKKIGTEPVWDETTCQYYAEWQEGDSLWQIWIEDVKSLRVKLNVMSTHKIGGVAVWRLGYGTEEAWDAVKAFANS